MFWYMKRIVVEKSKNRNEREGRRERNTADSLRSYIEERRRKKMYIRTSKKNGAVSTFREIRQERERNGDGDGCSIDIAEKNWNLTLFFKILNDFYMKI